MKYSPEQCRRFNAAYENSKESGKIFSIIHRGVVNYKSNWKQSRGGATYQIAFTIRQCFDRPDLDKVYGLTVGELDILIFEDFADFVTHFKEMATRNLDFRATDKPNWDVSAFAVQLSDLLTVELGPGRDRRKEKLYQPGNEAGLYSDEL